MARQLVDAHYQDRSCTAHAAFEEVLARPDIDAVIIATPDHWHVLIALGAVATRTRRRLTWSPTEERFVDDDAANRFLACREMRAPWKL